MFICGCAVSTLPASLRWEAESHLQPQFIPSVDEVDYISSSVCGGFKTGVLFKIGLSFDFTWQNKCALWRGPPLTKKKLLRHALRPCLDSNLRLDSLKSPVSCWKVLKPQKPACHHFWKWWCSLPSPHCSGEHFHYSSSKKCFNGIMHWFTTIPSPLGNRLATP